MTSWLPKLPGEDVGRYRAIVEAIRSDVASGALRAGDQLPPQRKLAASLNVAVGTVTKAYAEAVRRGYVRSGVGSGTFVREHPSLERHSVAQAGASAGKIDLSFNGPILGPAHEEAFRATLTEIATQEGAEAHLHYHRPWVGQTRHRHAGAAFLGTLGLSANPADVAVVSGAQHAASVILLSILKAGDLVATSDLSDPLMRVLLGSLGLRTLGIASDSDGILPDAFKALCEHEIVGALLVMPDHHSPTLAVMPEERRRALAEIARRFGVKVVENAVYRPLMKTAPPPLASFAPELSYYYTSLSKIIAPGLRLGFVAAPRGQLDNLIVGLGGTIWMAPPLMAEIGARWITDGTVARLAAWQQRKLEARNLVARELLGHLDVRTLPTGMHAWLTLPRPWRAAALVERIGTQGVLATPAETFATGWSPAPQAIRISLGGAVAGIDVLRAGLELILATLNEKVTGNFNGF